MARLKLFLITFHHSVLRDTKILLGVTIWPICIIVRRRATFFWLICIIARRRVTICSFWSAFALFFLDAVLYRMWASSIKPTTTTTVMQSEREIIAKKRKCLDDLQQEAASRFEKRPSLTSNLRYYRHIHGRLSELVKDVEENDVKVTIGTCIAQLDAKYKPEYDIYDVARDKIDGEMRAAAQAEAKLIAELKSLGDRHEPFIAVHLC